MEWLHGQAILCYTFKIYELPGGKNMEMLACSTEIQQYRYSIHEAFS